MPIRTVSSVLHGPCVVKQNGVPRFTVNSPGSTFLWTRAGITRTPHQNSGWREPTAYFSRRETAVGPNGIWRDGKSSAGPWSYEGNLMFAIPNVNELRYPADYNPSLRSRAIIDALSNLKDQRVNLAQAFAERAQTMDLVASNLTKIAKTALALRRGDYLRALAELGLNRTRRGYRINGRRAAREFGRRWLELQYGWKPLLSDIYGSLSQMAEAEKTNPLFVTVRGTASETWQEVWNPEDNLGYIPCTITATKNRGCKVALTYVPGNDLLRTVSQVGLTNPLLLAWELLPFSFVVDWAAPIGSILNVADATTGFSFLGGTITQRSKIHTAYTGGVSPDKTNTFEGYGFYKATKMDREVPIYSPIPETVPFKNPFTAPHVANALALLTVAFRGVR